MKQPDTAAMERDFASPVAETGVVAVAISGNKNSKYITKWALEKFGYKGVNVIFRLLHVRPTVTHVLTPIGNLVPISQVRDDVAAAYKKDIQCQTARKLTPFKNKFIKAKTQVEVFMIESDNLVDAIAAEAASGCIRTLVIGASSAGMFSRKQQNLSLRILKNIPKTCAVYVVRKGKLTSVRPSEPDTNALIADDSSLSFSVNMDSKIEFINSSNIDSSSQTDDGSFSSFSHPQSPGLQMQMFEALSTLDEPQVPAEVKLFETSNSRCQASDIVDEADDAQVPVEVKSFETSNSRCQSSDIIEEADEPHVPVEVKSLETSNSRWQSSDIIEEADDVAHIPCNLEIDMVLSHSSSVEISQADDQPCISAHASASDGAAVSESSDQASINIELEKLRNEFRHFQAMYIMTQTERIEESQKLNAPNKRKLEDADELLELNYQMEKAKEMTRQEIQKCEAARREAEAIKKLAETEAEERKEAEMKIQFDAKEKQKLQYILADTMEQYLKFTWEEILIATSSLAEHLIVGKGVNGTVYKSTLNSTTAAVKVLHSNGGRAIKQFHRELEILSRIRHPHLLLLLGACPDYGCMVYEYMENGNLAARLQCENGTQPIPWHRRFRIAWEIASALVFLHNTKPKPIIHRDLKPANILLDHNFVSKIGDVGLSTMISKHQSLMSIMYDDIGPVGTVCYIDPEYQRTGVISPECDVYGFGMVVLQLLTGRQAMALPHIVEMAINNGKLKEILDSKAGNWPMEEAKELAVLALSCVEIRRADRPDLKSEVLPKLEMLKDRAVTTQSTAPNFEMDPPVQFLCPILKEIMNEPWVAADGHSYDRKAIEKWFEENDHSPTTDLPLPNKNLFPNLALASAIAEWKSMR